MNDPQQEINNELRVKYPFKFLDSYGIEDTEFFFGRDTEVSQMYEMVFKTDLFLVYGTTGTGKTSLIQCGLAKEFKSYDWCPYYIRRGVNLNNSLKKVLKEELKHEDNADKPELSWLNEFSDIAGEEMPTSKDSISELLVQLYYKKFKPIYLIFDQFEELYILGSDEEQKRFIKSVIEILKIKQPIKILISIREEYLGHLYEFEKAVPQLLTNKLRVEAMTLPKVCQVIIGATASEHSNVHLEKGNEKDISEYIFELLRGKKQALSIQLPYLQVLLDRLYLNITNDESRKSEALITMDAVKKIGDISNLLRSFLEKQVFNIYREFHKKYQEFKKDQIWYVLSPFVTLDGTKEPLRKEEVCKRVLYIDPKLIVELIEALIKSRILRFSENDGLYEIAHDSLAKHISEKRTDEEIAILEIESLIKNQASLRQENREMFSEKQIKLIEPYLTKITLNEEEKVFIEESKKILLKRKQDKEKEAARKRQRDRVLKVISFIAICIITGLAGWALSSRNDALTTLSELEKSQARSKAKELLFYGESYEAVEEFESACKSYQEGLELVKDYEEDALHIKLKSKVESICEQP